jgi:hypothetical protein
MPKVNWKFSVCGKSGYQTKPNSIGVDVSSPSEVVEISQATGFDVTGWDRGNESYRKIEVNEPEDSLRLSKILEIIEDKYGFVPASSKVVPEALRDRVYGVKKFRQFSRYEIDLSEYLCISHIDRKMADFLMGTKEDTEAENYLVKNYKNGGTVLFGILSPFPAFVVHENLKLALEDAGLTGLLFKPIVNAVGIWKLTSSIILPRCKLRLIDGSGTLVRHDDWCEPWTEKYYDDSGYEPPVLRYNKHDLSLIGSFDVAITLERTGGIKPNSFRRLVVSQNFRAFLKKQKISGIYYIPVEID